MSLVQYRRIVGLARFASVRSVHEASQPARAKSSVNDALKVVVLKMAQSVKCSIMKYFFQQFTSFT